MSINFLNFYCPSCKTFKLIPRKDNFQCSNSRCYHFKTKNFFKKKAKTPILISEKLCDTAFKSSNINSYVKRPITFLYNIKAKAILFNKSTGCILGPNDNVLKPKNSQKLDHEIEVAIVIGKKGKNIKKSSAMDFVFGFCICNDYSERDWQKERNGQWIKGKSIAGNLGPILVTRDEIKEPYNLNLSLKLNGRERQKGNTKELIFNFEYLVSYLSEFMTLYPGTIITTGTPAGTIMEDENPQFLKSGDELVLKIDYLGEQKQLIVNE